jgi:cytosine/adenosine deaminase-related metal-dependent hydrolase
VHIGEGLDPAAREELSILKQKGLLTDKTAIIHGTAFGAAEFDDMAAAKAKLIWSPQSNLALYDKTTNIKMAKDRGIEVSLGVDWNLTGSDNVFDELRTAAAINNDDFDNAIGEDEWLKLITVNPARALALEDKIGRLAPGYKADITVVREKHADPNQNLLAARLGDVQMVWVGGDPLYGNRAAIDKLKPGACEALTVYGSRKRICVKDTKDPVEGSDQTLAAIRVRLQEKIPALAPLTP